MELTKSDEYFRALADALFKYKVIGVGWQEGKLYSLSFSDGKTEIRIMPKGDSNIEVMRGKLSYIETR